MCALPTDPIPSGASPLTLTGPCGYTIEEDRIVITIAEIANRRDPGDLSGTLAIELWALAQPYAGGGFTGTPLCGTRIGELRGAHVLTNCRYDLIFQAPPPGTWSLSLMLREWSATGYLTRDYVNFALPYTVERKSTIMRSETDNVISVEFAGNRKPLARPPEPAVAPPVANEAPAAADTSSLPESRSDAAVSRNTASFKEIAAVRGISTKVAENIVAARPSVSLDERLTVKGVGAKLLKKVRQFIKL
jgi:DNA uptake protein ComE-like DNA-binding protein